MSLSEYALVVLRSNIETLHGIEEDHEQDIDESTVERVRAARLSLAATLDELAPGWDES